MNRGFTFVVLSGQVVSDAYPVANVRGGMGLHFPAIVSGQAYLQASYDTTSANFFRLQNLAATSTHVLVAANGSRVFPVEPGLLFGNYIRLEVQNAQTSPVSITVMTKL